MVLITSALSNLQNDHILTINFSRSGRISGTRSAPLVVHVSLGNPQESTEIRNDGWSRQFLKWHLMEQRGACVLAGTSSDDARDSTIQVG